MNLIKATRSSIGWYHAARWLADHHIPVVPRLLDYLSRFVFSCWVPHTARIGKNVILGYGGLGIVIHSNAIIGNNVEIGQGVTLGGNSREPGEPEVGDDVFIGCGAKLLGPIKIGQGSVIGANSVVVDDVPAHCVVAGHPARIVHEGIDINKYLWHRKRTIKCRQKE